MKFSGVRVFYVISQIEVYLIFPKRDILLNSYGDKWLFCITTHLEYDDSKMEIEYNIK